MKKIPLVYDMESMDSLISAVKETGEKWQERVIWNLDDAVMMKPLLDEVVHLQTENVHRLLAYEIVGRTLEVLKQNPPSDRPLYIPNELMRVLPTTWKEIKKELNPICEDMELDFMQDYYHESPSKSAMRLITSRRGSSHWKVSLLIPLVSTAMDKQVYLNALEVAGKKCDRIMYNLFEAVSQTANGNCLREYLTVLYERMKTEEKEDALYSMLFPDLESML